MSKIVELKDISKSYKEKAVLSHVNLSFEVGSTTCIEGASGIGKTTLLRIIAGLEAPDSGSVERKSDSIAFVFQEDRLSENYNAVRNIRLVTGKRMEKKEIESHLAELGLKDLSKPVKEFSGGMKRRVAICRAVCYEADLLILDEPFKGLDAASKIRTMEYVKKYTKGKTIIYVTHDGEEMTSMGGNRIELSTIE